MNFLPNFALHVGEEQQVYLVAVKIPDDRQAIEHFPCAQIVSNGDTSPLKGISCG